MMRAMLLIVAATCASAAPSRAALVTGDPLWATPAPGAPAPQETVRVIPIEIISIGAPAEAQPETAPAAREPARDVVCASVSAADCYAASWFERVAAQATRTAPPSVLAAAPFAIFSVCAIGYGLLRRSISWARSSGSDAPSAPIMHARSVTPSATPR